MSKRSTKRDVEYPLRRIADGDSKLSSALDVLWQQAAQLQWDQTGPTQQNREHCLRVEHNVARLVTDSELGIICSPSMAYVLSASAALHDIAKAKSAIAAKYASRGLDHGRVAQEMLLREQKLQHLVPDPTLRLVVAEIAGAHDSGDFSHVHHRRTFDGQSLFPKSLAALFRLSDMLETTYERVPWLYRLIMGEKFLKSTKVWIARAAVTDWHISQDKKEVRLEVSADGLEEARAITRLLKLLNKAITPDHRSGLQHFECAGVSGHLTLPATFALDPEDAVRIERLLPRHTTPYQLHMKHVELCFVGAAKPVIVRETIIFASAVPGDRISVPLGLAADRVELVKVCDELGDLRCSTRTNGGTVTVLVDIQARRPALNAEKRIQIEYQYSKKSGARSFVIGRGNAPSAGCSMTIYFRSNLKHRFEGFNVDTHGAKSPLNPPITRTRGGGYDRYDWFVNKMTARSSVRFSWHFL